MRGVVLEFIVEEVSQYPFWSTKVIALLTSASPGVKPSAASIISSAFKIYFERLRLGSGKIIAFYEGIVPYLGAAVIWNFGHLETEIHKYHSFMRCGIWHNTCNIHDRLSAHPCRDLFLPQACSPLRRIATRGKNKLLLCQLRIAIVVTPTADLCTSQQFW